MQQLKFSSLWLAVLLLTITLGGCKDDAEPPTDLTVSTTEIEVGCDGETMEVMVSCNSLWSASTTASWISIKPSYSSGNGALEIKVLPNNGNYREGTIEFYVKGSTEAKATNRVGQKALGEHDFSLSPMVVALENGNLEAEVDVAPSNPHNWTFEIVEGGEWMEVSKSDDKLEIKADVLKILYRTGRIDVISAGIRKPVYVVQGDFREVPVANTTTMFYGQLNNMPYTTSLIYVEGEKYNAPYVGQQYLDHIMIQLNTQPIVPFEEFKITEGCYPILSKPSNETAYVSAGFFDDELGVYGSCWLRKWYYMEQDYGYNSLNIFTEGNVYITTDEDNMNIYLAATGYNQELEPCTYVLKMQGKVNLTDMTKKSGIKLNTKGLIRQH